MVKRVIDDYTEKDHQGEVQVALEHLGHDGYNVINIRRVSRMVLLWGKNVTEIYYEKGEGKD